MASWRLRHLATRRCSVDSICDLAGGKPGDPVGNDRRHGDEGKVRSKTWKAGGAPKGRVRGIETASANDTGLSVASTTNPKDVTRSILGHAGGGRRCEDRVRVDQAPRPERTGRSTGVQWSELLLGGHPFAFALPTTNTAFGPFDMALESVSPRRDGRGESSAPIRSIEHHPVGSHATDAKTQEGTTVTAGRPAPIHKQDERLATCPIEDGRVSTRPAD